MALFPALRDGPAWSAPPGEPSGQDTSAAAAAAAPKQPPTYAGFRSAGFQVGSDVVSQVPAQGGAGSASASVMGEGPGPPHSTRTQPSGTSVQHGGSLHTAARRLAAAEAVINAQWRSAQAAASTAAGAARAGPRLSGDNIGYRLLQRAGWKEGHGLGSQEQGRIAPLDAVRNPGVRGIGFERQQQRAQQRIQGSQAVQGTAQGAGVAAGASGEAQGGEGQVVKRSRVNDIVESELAGESAETKVAIHKAQAAAAAEAARGRALQRSLYRAFNDPFDNVGASTANTNPLKGRNRLTATNPLLDSDEED